MMDLILIRHGESEGNVRQVVYGHTDYPMTERGLSQLPLIAEILAKYPLEKIYTSPLVRAKVLAEEIARWRKLPLQEDERLKEIFFGRYENLDRFKVEEALGEDFYKLIGIVDHYAIPEGEHQDQFLQRIESFLQDLGKQNQACIGVATHFGVIKGVLHLLFGYDKKTLRSFSIKPGGILHLRVKKDKTRLMEIIQTYQ